MATDPPASPDDAALNRRVAQGDRAAFDVLVTRHEQRLRGFLRKLAGTHAADDLAQEAFIRAWQRAHQFSGSGNYAAWLLRIGWHVFLDTQRHQASLHRRRDAAPAASERYEPTHETGIDIVAALATLAPKERACLLLCDLEGWSHTEAASLLDMPLGTLKSAIARAKAHLRKQLLPPDPDPQP